MLDIIIITVTLIAIFAGVTWYSILQSKEKHRAYMAQATIEAEEGRIAGGQEFNALLEQEMTQQQIDTYQSTVDDEPSVSLSTTTIIQAPLVDIVEDTLDLTPIVDEPQEEIQTKIDAIPDWDMMISFTILARDSGSLLGLDIKIALENLGFYHGDMDIFHRLSADSSKQPLFSVANLIDPGTLKPDAFSTMTTPGLLMFAKFPAPIDSLTLFEELFKTATSMADMLGGILCDELQQVVTQDTIESMRGKILKMNFTIHIENNQY
ncbi:MAG: hypothetical protein HRT92_03880 [Piscirickettsiaceae bacterium]|nr:hypothetical protein [Piscirickettsiaceae bacterium]